ncbi:MAG TPA: molybdenum cofactor guanylyltransferase, partial [Candidatus Dormibacteraeota bacterium]|nr:molybdenum cofactor guanylyltransferase [Candidatus Dormibacteraeota bacterium]
AGADARGLPCPAVPDRVPGQGPLGGIVTALRAAATELVLVVACDMPDPCPALAGHLLSRARADPAADAVVPRRAGRWEPLLAVYRRRAAAPLEAALTEGVLACHLALDRVRVLTIEEDEWRPLDPDGRSFDNWNAPADLPPPGTTGARGPQRRSA